MARVLIVDDSALMRRLLTGLLTGAGHEVAVARHGAEGLERLLDWRPDVVTLDVNMPEMDGLTALSLMMQARPTPTIMVSSLTARGARATFEALALGAVDFIAKPSGTISLSVDEIADLLLAKVAAAAKARLRAPRPSAASAAPVSPRPATGVTSRSRDTADADTGATATATTAALRTRPASAARPAVSVRSPMAARAGIGDDLALRTPRPAVTTLPGLVLVGVSTGGPRVLEEILPALPADLPWPVLVAQHMPSNFTDTFARRMDALCALTVRECAATMPIEPGHVYIGKGGSDMVVEERLGRLVATPKPESARHTWHPSVALLVETAMKHLPADRLVGVQLTGMGDDGAAEMTRLKQAGGRTIAESERTAIVFGMPHELIELGGASMVLPCDEVARQLVLWTGARG